MSVEFADADQGTTLVRRRRLLLIWQHPQSRRFCRVGHLDELVDGRFVFTYEPTATTDGFAPLPEFPDLNQMYVSTSLPAFFGNRVMSRGRENYQEYRGWLGLDGAYADTPIEVLARTGGARATDTFHIVDDLALGPDGGVETRFFASGVRHLDGADGRLAGLSEGATLELRDEPANPENPRAVLIDLKHLEPVGYVPDWLLDDVHELKQTAKRLRVVAERINPNAPSHLRLLCRIEASSAP